jgi:hypothetical protein
VGILVDKPQRLARNQEKVTATLHGGRVTPGSGAGSVKNDVRNTEWSFEVKTTTQKGYRLTEADLLTAERHALEDGRRMAFVIAFEHPDKPARRFVVMDESDFIEKVTEYGLAIEKGST